MHKWRPLNYLLICALALACGLGGGCVEDRPDSASTGATKYFTDKIEGTWAMACEDLTSFGDANIFGQIRAYTFSGNKVTFTYRYYSEATCVHLVAKYYATYTYAVTGALQPVGHKIDLTLLDDSAITLTAPVTADYNSRGVCGLFSGWFAFNPRSITGTGCETVLNNLIPFKNVGSTVYTIFGVDTSTSPMKLLVGDFTTGVGLTDSNRPAQFVTNPYWQE
jgi:hypothetical protein